MNVKKGLLALLAVVVLAALAACSATGPASGDPLDGTSWVLVGYGLAAPLPGTRITVSFEDGQVQGSAGCNSYGGSYQVSGDSISVRELFNTEMACLEPEGVMEQEQTYLQYLGGVETFSISHGQLQMIRADGETLTFIPAE